MAKVTSKLQVTIPKSIAEKYGIKPGDEIAFEAAGPQIRVGPPHSKPGRLSRAERLRLFDEEEERIRERWKSLEITPTDEGRGWKRDELYRRDDGRYRGEAPSRGQGDGGGDGESG